MGKMEFKYFSSPAMAQPVTFFYLKSSLNVAPLVILSDLCVSLVAELIGFKRWKQKEPIKFDEMQMDGPILCSVAKHSPLFLLFRTDRMRCLKKVEGMQ